MSVKYEEKRKQRMEENKKRMEELNLHYLAQSLKPSLNIPTIKRSYVKNVNTSTPSRRSTRTADKTPPNYKPKQDSIKTFAKPQREYTIVRSNLFYRVSISEEERMNAANKAKELAFSLGSEFPTFVKPLTLSHVLGGCVRLAETFCKTHLPDHNQVFNVIDEEEKEWQLNYLVKYQTLGGGWRTFSTAHELVDGDALVFQLTKPNSFKVYIIRVNKVISCF